ncbi:MAG: ATP-binding protein [Syntrophorhabdales bacterium]|jgi:PAS domain S-box-containing protein
MRFSRLAPKRFSSRLFLVTFIAGLIPIIIFTILIGSYGARIEKEITRIIEKGYEQDMSQSEIILREMGEASVYSKVSDIAQELDMVIQSVPWMTVADLQRDQKFREVAIQTIGKTGYTFIFESDTAIVRFHRDLRLENRNLPRVFRHLPDLQGILRTSLKGPSPAYGYYQLKAGDGNIMKRFIHIIPLHNATADGVRLSVAATVNVDDFLKPIKEAEAGHNETKRFLMQASKAAIGSFKQTGLFSMGIGILTVSLIAFVVGIYLSRSVKRLREATSRVIRGDLSTPVKRRGSGEVAAFIDDFNTMVDRLAQTTVSKQLLQASEARLKTANGDLRREIAERERTEEALAAEKERLSITLRSIGDGVITTDSEGRIALMNNAAEKLTGWQQDQAIGHGITDVLRIAMEAPYHQAGLGEALRNGREEPAVLLNQKVLVARDGTVRVIAETRSTISDKGGGLLGTVIVFRDITLEKQMEEELLKARKLESLGVLAGGIAHDFNNLLAVILGNISFGKMFLKEKDKVSDRLAEAELACMRGKDLTYQLLAFAHGGEPLRRVVAPAPVIEDAARSCLGESPVAVSFSFPVDLFPVRIDEAQVRQVIQRIVENANEAMGEGGVLTVGAENVSLGPNNPLALKQGGYVRIFFKDEGPGIAWPDLQRIFDPYFTKKEMGNEKGTGLSLSICYSIVKDHGGSITAESEVGKGSVFHIYLPAAEPGDPLDQGAGPAPSSGPARIGGAPAVRPGRLLFMDDDQSVRDVIVEILLHLGYQVEFARDGFEAIEQYVKAAREGRPFDIVITDLTVSYGMGGKELIKKLRTIDPRVRAIISSGYSNDPVLKQFKEYGFLGFVAKPYKVEDLCAVLDAVMQESATDVGPANGPMAG